ncbi:glycosyltransferase family 91 protein [Ascoidea rubescens DSM 1968]|uniref:Glycosyltransferase family 91 protein n=1 Tax=Ascoidea rubescens DSM 1968 TaxID=1344418 RepID=A0A1D2VS88_9ASCO|nr:glycosyltransferase family 91 protein [Ascoidea rubescens DSM 1968]ODV64460.1 glycosyltransferase family 91 protein [Ascoidea rubescens DSM 1968]
MRKALTYLLISLFSFSLFYQLNNYMVDSSANDVSLISYFNSNFHRKSFSTKKISITESFRFDHIFNIVLNQNNNNDQNNNSNNFSSTPIPQSLNNKINLKKITLKSFYKPQSVKSLHNLNFHQISQLIKTATKDLNTLSPLKKNELMPSNDDNFDCDIFAKQYDIFSTDPLDIPIDSYKYKKYYKSLISNTDLFYLFDDINLHGNDEILQKNWFYSSLNSIWLKDYNMHFTISDLMYSQHSDISTPTFNLITYQFLNNQFNIINSYNSNPNQIEIDNDNDNDDIGNTDNTNRNYFDFRYGPNSYQNISYPSFPSFFDFQFYYNISNSIYDSGYGPKDAKMIKKTITYQFYNNQKQPIKSVEYEEPIILFNMLSEIDLISRKSSESYSNSDSHYSDNPNTNKFNEPILKRILYCYLPFQDKLIPLNIPHQIKIDHTFQPFFKDSLKNKIRIDLNDYDNIENFDDDYEFEFKNGIVNLVYSANPLKTLQCSLDTGVCAIEKPIKSIDNDHFKGDKLVALSKKTRMLQFLNFNNNSKIVDFISPASFPQSFLNNKNKTQRYQKRLTSYNIWLGFVNSEIRDAACSQITYKPSLVLLSNLKNSENSNSDSDDNSNYNYNIELISDTIDFNFDLQKSVKIENIAYWEIDESNSKDYMGLIISDDNYNTKVVHLNGVLPYILNFDFFKNHENDYHEYGDEDFFVSKEEKKSIFKVINNSRLTTCLLKSAGQICKM